jgi:hypothetical protein
MRVVLWAALIWSGMTTDRMGISLDTSLDTRTRLFGWLPLGGAGVCAGTKGAETGALLSASRKGGGMY